MLHEVEARLRELLLDSLLRLDEVGLGIFHVLVVCARHRRHLLLVQRGAGHPHPIFAQPIHVGTEAHLFTLQGSNASLVHVHV